MFNYDILVANNDIESVSASQKKIVVKLYCHVGCCTACGDDDEEADGVSFGNC